MSAASQRRDVFDPETVRDFAKVVGTTERLKMLCLLTYADICAVNPEAMTPWKAELLWQLYAATANYLTRSVDDERLRITGTSSGKWKRFWRCWGLPPALRTCVLSWKDSHGATPPPIRRSKSPGILNWPADWRANRLRWRLHARNGHFELTVVTADRPYLFASITGTLAAWGMSIVKADAFANAARHDSGYFHLCRSAPHPRAESYRKETGSSKTLCDVLKGTLELEKLLSGRARAEAASQPKVEVTTQRAV